MKKNIWSFQLPVPSVFFAPFGYVAVITGMETADPYNNIVAFATFPVLDNAACSLALCSEKVRTEIRTHIERGISQESKVLEANRGLFDSWLATWPKPVQSNGPYKAPTFDVEFDMI